VHAVAAMVNAEWGSAAQDGAHGEMVATMQSVRVCQTDGHTAQKRRQWASKSEDIFKRDGRDV
jgi:hypothetical protein